MLKVKRTTLTNHKRAGVAVLISDNIDFKNVTRDSLSLIMPLFSKKGELGKHLQQKRIPLKCYLKVK